MINTRVFFLALGIAFLGTALITKRLIPWLAEKRIGQKILEIGPSWHRSKNGTPTMGGLGFVIASTVAFTTVVAFWGSRMDDTELCCIINIFLFGTLNAIVGVIDDIAKLKKCKNEGLTPTGKLVLQSMAAVVFLVLMSHTVEIEAVIKIPFTDIVLDVGFFYYVIAFLMLCGITNAVNLTDGLDGLAATSVLVVGVFLAFVGIAKMESITVSFFSAILIGSSVGFLIFNLHPAKIFMGDTGSLFFGGIVVGASFATENPLIVLVYGFVFLCEAASVILQVAYFKLTKGKRLFKMAPLHHHFEKCGMSEMQVVSLFGVAGVMACTVAFFAL